MVFVVLRWINNVNPLYLSKHWFAFCWEEDVEWLMNAKIIEIPFWKKEETILPII